MTESNYTTIIYGYLRTLGGPGDEVMTSIRPWLEREYGLSYAEAARARSIAVKGVESAEKVRTAQHAQPVRSPTSVRTSTLGKPLLR